MLNRNSFRPSWRKNWFGISAKVSLSSCLGMFTLVTKMTSSKMYEPLHLAQISKRVNPNISSVVYGTCPMQRLGLTQVHLPWDKQIPSSCCCPDGLVPNVDSTSKRFTVTTKTEGQKILLVR